MTAQIMDGTSVAQALLDATAVGAEEFEDREGRKPCLATVLVGDDPASHTYVRMKRARCARVGIESRSIELASNTSTGVLVAEIESLSADPTVDGILLQHPAPAHVDERAAFEAIVPDKDVDGVTMHSFAAMAFGKPELIRGDWIRPGAVVIDAGYNPGNIGDVEYAEASERAGLITPVPGGVGPMTIAVLLDQTLQAARSGAATNSPAH